MVNYTTYDDVSTLNFSNGSANVLFNYGNTITNGMVAPVFLIAVALIAFLSLLGIMRSGRAVAASGFITVLMSVLMMGAGVLHPAWVFCSVGYLAIGLYLSQKDGYG